MFFSPNFEFGNWWDQASVPRASTTAGAPENSKSCKFIEHLVIRSKKYFFVSEDITFK